MKRNATEDLSNMPLKKRRRTSSFSLISCQKVCDETIEWALDLFDYYATQVNQLDLEFEMRRELLYRERDQIQNNLDRNIRTR
jgi:hypothetical protein